jgi:Xaa-Pro aminopeptidase
MKSHFTSDFYANNRRRLMERIPKAELILIPANVKLQKNADEPFQFRQDSSFWYLTGLDIAEALLVLDVQQGNEWLLLPYRHAHRDQWETGIDLNEIQATAGIKSILYYREGITVLKKRLQSATSIHTLLPPTRRFVSVYGIRPNPSRNIWLDRVKRIKPGIKVENVREAIKDLRIIKQDVEIMAIAEAINVTQASFKDVQLALPNMQFEYEVRAELHAGFQKRGAIMAFDSVIASGPHSALLHYEKTDGRLKQNHMLLIDAGAAVQYYAADITRIFKPVNGMSARQQAVFDAVLRARHYAASLIRPGVKHRVYEQQVRECIGEELVKLGLIKRPTKSGIYKYFPSLTTHHLGLDVHDIANYNEEFEQNMVVTIEPGIYIQEEGIGVRLEDDVLITENGINILSDDLPLTPM